MKFKMKLTFETSLHLVNEKGIQNEVIVSNISKKTSCLILCLAYYRIHNFE